MKNVVIQIRDDRKAEILLEILGGLEYVDIHVADGLKIWDGQLPAIDKPVYVDDFKIFARDELHER